MTKLDILLKCVTLLYKESLLDDNDNSVDVISTLLDTFENNKKKKFIGGETDAIENLIQLLKEMCKSIEDGFDKQSLLQSLQMIFKDDEEMKAIVKTMLDTPEDSKQIRRSVTILRKNIVNYYKEERIGMLLRESNINFSFNRGNITNINDFLSTLITRLESLQLDSKSKDPAIIDELDITDTNKVSDIIEEVKDINNSSRILKFGWHRLNKMCQGGVRKGELLTIGALQHKYKSGFTLSLFMQLALFNKPVISKEGKKPLLLLISLEDPLTNIFMFMYEYLYKREHGIDPNLTNISSDEMSEYVKEKLSVNGYHIKVIRADPTQWDYRGVFNKIVKLESEGYELDALVIDYLNMLPKIGCITTGALGTDIRDLFRRFRNYCAARDIALITPHQLSTDAKQLIRNGIPPTTFVKEVAEKGYYEGTRQLDQEIDLELYVHVAKIGKKYYLTVQRGKHKIPSIIRDEDKYFILPFDSNGPIIDDLEKEDIGYSSVEDILNNENNEKEGEFSVF